MTAKRPDSRAPYTVLLDHWHSQWNRSVASTLTGSEGRTTVNYYLAATLPVSFGEALERTEEALKQEGFGIISRIDIQETLKTKIDVEFRPYTILGACNPKLAFEALKIEDKVGTMLPCNVVVQEFAPHQSEVAAIDPVASMQAIENNELTRAAQEVRTRLGRVIEALGAIVESD